MKRFHQLLLIATFLPLCWLWMMVVHELGHILAAYASGGRVTCVVLHPLAISRTDIVPNPSPLAVVWAGPLVGVCLPLALLAILRLAKRPWAFLVQFFAGFCLIANGAYIGIGWLDRVGDTGEMLKYGTPIWCLWLFGILCLPAGLLSWHRLGRHFGFGENDGTVEPVPAYCCAALLVLTVAAELFLSRSG